MAVPAFRRLWIAGIVSDAGDWLMFIALPLVVLRLSQSALGTSFAFVLELAPTVLLAPVAARLVDLLPRRELMVAATLAQAASLLPLLAVHDRFQLPLVYCVIVAQATFATVFEPAKNAVLPTLVGPERTVSANAFVGLNNDLGRLIGGPLGGVLLATVALGGVTLVDLATYLVAAAFVATLPKRGEPRAASGGAARPSRGGIRRAFADPAVRDPLAVAFVASVAQGLFIVLFVFFVTTVIGRSATDVGVLRGVQAIGAITAGVLLGTVGARVPVLRLTQIGVASFAVLTAVIWNLSFLTHGVTVYGFLFAAAGAPAVLMSTGLISVLQSASSDAQRGSTFAALGLSQATGQAIGLLLAGGLLEIVGTMALLEIQAATYAVAAVLTLTLLPRRRANERARPTRQV
ncbi:MFS transporter [uncultured Jatrophihabitans sp.]|uniref:MFS transporter n=1 Tax=uncultured Jatrophihabitans sp. TaxID=1610747 RepID=UPI0035C9C5D3